MRYSSLLFFLHTIHKEFTEYVYVVVQWVHYCCEEGCLVSTGVYPNSQIWHVPSACPQTVHFDTAFKSSTGVAPILEAMMASKLSCRLKFAATLDWNLIGILLIRFLDRFILYNYLSNRFYNFLLELKIWSETMLWETFFTHTESVKFF